MANLENRFIRIEDWKGNVYYPISDSNTSTAGTISKEASSESGSDPYTEGQYVSDSKANGGKSILLTSSSDRKVLYKASFTSVPFGKVSVGIRAKSNVVTGDTNLIEMNSYFRDSSGESPVDVLLDTYNISAKMFETADTYISIPHIIEYSGVTASTMSLVVEIIILPNTGATIWFDQMYVAMDIGSSSLSESREIYVDGITIVIKDKQ